MAPRTLVPHKGIKRLDKRADDEKFAKGRYFEADCPPTVQLKHLVRIAGPAIAGVRQVDLVDPTDLTKMPAIGIVVEKPSATKCVVQIIGEANGGLFAGLTPNGRYFVGTDARLAYPPPTPEPGAHVFVQTQTYTGGDITREDITIGGTLLRRIDYTYSGGDVSTEVVKVYASDGATVKAQVTRTYNYTNGDLSSVVTTRDV